jgi:hypothetical protein
MEATQTKRIPIDQIDFAQCRAAKYLRSNRL